MIFANSLLSQFSQYGSLFLYDPIPNDMWRRLKAWLYRNSDGNCIYWRIPLNDGFFVVVSPFVCKRYKVSKLPSGDDLFKTIDNLLKNRQDGSNISRSINIVSSYPSEKNKHIDFNAFTSNHTNKIDVGIKKELWRVRTENMRAKVRGLVCDLTLDEWVDILKQFNYKCAYCGGNFDEMEHIVSISNGGGTTRYNVVPSCENCNREKSRSNSKKNKKLLSLKSDLADES